MYYFTNYSPSIDKYIIVCDEEKKNIVVMWADGQKYYDDTIDEMINDDSVEILSNARKWLDRYFSGEKPSISEIPLSPIGTAFRQEVWKFLYNIPYGEVITYGEIAKKLNREKLLGQALGVVGGAVVHTPISIIIP